MFQQGAYHRLSQTDSNFIDRRGVRDGRPGSPPPAPVEPQLTPPVATRTAVEALAMAALLLFAGSLLFLDPRALRVPRLAAALALLAPLLLAGDCLGLALRPRG